MHYVLYSSTGNMVGSYEEHAEANAALERIVAAEPEAADEVALFSFGDDGMPVDGPIFAGATTTS